MSKIKKQLFFYAIPKKYVVDTTGRALSKSEKAEIDQAVKRTVKEYSS